MNKVKGFTLIELIVVIAIIGVLSAILVPTLLGNVKKSKLTTANSSASGVFRAAATVLTEAEQDGKVYASGDYSHSSGNGTHDNDFEAGLCKAYGSLSGSYWGVRVANGCAIASTYAEKVGSKYIGCYPKITTDYVGGSNDVVSMLDYAVG